MMATDRERLSRTAVEFFGDESAVGDMRTMYLMIPKNQAATVTLKLIDSCAGDDTRSIRHGNMCFAPLEKWSTRNTKSAYIPMCDTPMAAFIVGRSLLQGLVGQSIAIDFQVVGLMVPQRLMIEAVKTGTMTRHQKYPCPHWQLYGDLVMAPTETPKKCGTSEPRCVPTRFDCIPTDCFIRIRSNCSLVLQPGPRCMGDLPGVVANNSGGMLPSGSIGITLVFAIESTQVDLIKQMTGTHRMLIYRRLCHNDTMSAVLNCITNAKPQNVLKKTLSEVAATYSRKRVQMDSVAEEQYVFDDMAFLVFSVILASNTVAHLFEVGALSRHDRDLFRCEFDIDNNGKFVLEYPHEALLTDHRADIKMAEYTLATNVKRRRFEVDGDIKLTKQVVLPAEE
jgi:hypothetical protein